MVKDLVPDVTNFYNQCKCIEPWLKRQRLKVKGDPASKNYPEGVDGEE